MSYGLLGQLAIMWVPLHNEWSLLLQISEGWWGGPGRPGSHVRDRLWPVNLIDLGWIPCDAQLSLSLSVAPPHTHRVSNCRAPLMSFLTCCGDRREDPTLSVWHRRAVGRVVLPQDLHAAAPRRRRHSVRVIARPVPHQNPEVILSVNLQRGWWHSESQASDALTRILKIIIFQVENERQLGL